MIKAFATMIRTDKHVSAQNNFVKIVGSYDILILLPKQSAYLYVLSILRKCIIS